MRASVPLNALLFATLSMAQAPPPTGGAVEGTVINSATGAGIGGAAVRLLAGPSKYETTSDAVGRFKFSGVALGTYRPAVEKDGFSSPPPDLGLAFNPPLRVASTSDALKVELKLTPLISIRGRVLNPEGKPAAGMEVRLNPNIYGEVQTDKEGGFAFESVRQGSYTLSASPPESAKPLLATDGTKTAMVTTYYPSVTDSSLAQPIAVRGETDLTGYEIRMQAAPVHRVRGRVLDENGKPAAGAVLTLYRQQESVPDAMGIAMRPEGSVFAMGVRRAPVGGGEVTTYAKDDGSFEFASVRSGAWRITALADTSRSRGTETVVVGGNDVDDLEIRIAAPFKMAALLESRDPGAGPPSSTQFVRAAVTLVNAEGNEFAASGFIQPKGGMYFENLLPGRYNAFARPGLSAQIYLGESDVTGQTFPLTAGGAQMRIVLKTWSGTVRGTVEKGEGATVILIPQRVDGVSLGQTAKCGPGGSFELNEVSPGDYYIAAFDRVQNFQPSAALLSLVPSRGTTVKVEERSTANVTLSVNPAPR